MDGIPSQAATAAGDDTWEVAGRRFRSRLIVGTGRYKDLEETGRAIEASGAEVVTVAVRRVNPPHPKAPMPPGLVGPPPYTHPPQTTRLHTPPDPVPPPRPPRQGRGWDPVKLEVLGAPPFL